METIKTDDDYYQLIENARDPPFIIIKDSEIIVKDFETLIPKKVDIPKNLHIRDAVRLIYFPNGHVNVFNNYNEIPNGHIISSAIEFDDLLKAQLAVPIGISKEKVNDEKMLLRYLTPQRQNFSNNLLSKTS